jgi:hypothetical protein
MMPPVEKDTSTNVSHGHRWLRPAYLERVMCADAACSHLEVAVQHRHVFVGHILLLVQPQQLIRYHVGLVAGGPWDMETQLGKWRQVGTPCVVHLSLGKCNDSS